ncbi:hypothetical protein [Gemmata sp.]|uniref:hypothetical protein n=1 Tax=Gemmata sp. TaxID=1914242 RepID=UPI003F6ECAAC
MSSQPAPRPRLAVEPLEDRLAPATFTVTSVDNVGEGTLRNAIIRANATPGADTITFAIGTGLQQIRVMTTPLPAITDRVNINGRSQPGYAGLPLVLVNGAGAGVGATGLTIERGGSGSVITGLGVNQFNGDAIRINADNCRVRACHIGVLFTGAEELSNAGNGVRIYAAATGNIIGGVNPAARNLISGNDANGVLIAGAATTGNVVAGNHFGTGSNGTEFIGNGVIDTPTPTDGAGVRIQGGAFGNLIGGTAPGAGNLISANTVYGVVIDGSPGNTIQGNYIGTDASGTAELGNFEHGIYLLNGASGNLIGGATVAAGNIISGNGLDGVHVEGTGTRGNVIRGNRIGRGTRGTNVGNGAAGVWVADGATGNSVVGNVLAANIGPALQVEGGNTVADNTVL